MVEPPDTLYYYTDSAGLAGMLAAPSEAATDDPTNPLHHALTLWASDVRYMNDSHELSYGASLLQQELRNPWVTGFENNSDKILRILRQVADQFAPADVFEWPTRYFASCFCEEGDLLSQWRGYGGGTGGFAIGLSREALETSFVLAPLHDPGSKQQFRTDLTRVTYGDDDNGRRSFDLVNQLIQRIGTDSDTDLETLTGFAYNEVATMKNDAFRAEHEWRLWTHSTNRELKVDVRPRGGTLLPYLPFLVNVGPNPPISGHAISSPINDLVIGPGPNQSAQFCAARDLIISRGFDASVARLSTIPYRG